LTLFFIQYISFSAIKAKLTRDVPMIGKKRSELFTVFSLVDSFSFAIWSEVGEGEEDENIEADGVGIETQRQGFGSALI
jgi:hypothetical protein